MNSDDEEVGDFLTGSMHPPSSGTMTKPPSRARVRARVSFLEPGNDEPVASVRAEKDGTIRPPRRAPQPGAPPSPPPAPQTASVPLPRSSSRPTSRPSGRSSSRSGSRSGHNLDQAMTEAAHSTPVYLPGLAEALRTVAGSMASRDLSARSRGLAQVLRFSATPANTSSLITAPSCIDILSAAVAAPADRPLGYRCKHMAVTVVRNLTLVHPIYDALLIMHPTLLSAIGGVLEEPVDAPGAGAAVREAAALVDGLMAHVPHCELVMEKIGLNRLTTHILSTDLPTQVHALQAICYLSSNDSVVARLPSTDQNLIPQLVLAGVYDDDDDDDDEYDDYDDYDTSSDQGSDAVFDGALDAESGGSFNGMVVGPSTLCEETNYTPIRPVSLALIAVYNIARHPESAQALLDCELLPLMCSEALVENDGEGAVGRQKKRNAQVAQAIVDLLDLDLDDY